MTDKIELSLLEDLYKSCVKIIKDKTLHFRSNLFYLAGMDDDNIVQSMVLLDIGSKRNKDYFKPLEHIDNRPYGCCSMPSISPDILNEAAAELYRIGLVPMGIIRFFMSAGNINDAGTLWDYLPDDRSFVLSFVLHGSVINKPGYYIYLRTHHISGFMNQSKKFTNESFFSSSLISLPNYNDKECYCDISGG